MLSPTTGASAPVFAFCLSCDITAQVRFRLDRMTGRIPAYADVDMAPGGTVSPSSVFVTATLCDETGPLGPPSRTPYSEAALSGAAWESHLTFDPKYRDLRPTAQLALTVWEIREGDAPAPLPLGGATLRLFSKHGRLKTGRHVLTLWPGKQADEAVPSLTPGKLSKKDRGEVGRVAQALKRLQRGEFEDVPWLDTLSIAAAEAVLAADARRAPPERLQLILDLPVFSLPVVYEDVKLPITAPPGIAAMTAAEGTAEALHTPLPGTYSPTAAAAHALEPSDPSHSAAHAGTEAQEEPTAATATPPASPRTGGTSNIGSLWLGNRLTIIHDPELGKETPAEIKAQKLARSGNRGVLDASLRPNTAERDVIDAALALPPGQALARRERELLWRFRFALASEPRALTKFLKSVDWSDAAEADHALELASRWSSISVADALELLSPDYAVEAVRSLAVNALERTPDDELLLFLLQLVQALRYEPADENRLGTFLVTRSRRSAAVASALFWYLCAELDDASFGERAKAVQTALLMPSPDTNETETPLAESSVPDNCIPLQLKLVARLRHLSEEMRKPKEGERAPPRTARQMTEKLREVLGPGKACFDLTFFECPCPLDPEIKLGGIIPSDSTVFASKINPLKVAFKVLDPEDIALNEASAGAAASGPQERGDASSARSPSAPEPEHATHLGTSTDASSPGAQSPRTSDMQDEEEGKLLSPAAAPIARSLSLMYKRGDDLRQDQLVLQLISLIDRLLKQDHLDLRITAYAVLPTSSSDGLIEFVPGAYTISSVQAQHGSVAAFLSAYHPEPRGPGGIRPDVHENYVRSCAGCMVAAHVLGIGDRHLDNIMLTTDGRLFHIDFGYAFGRDPKFGNNAPLVLSPVLVEGMGGTEGPGYRRFITLCGEAFNILRKSARLLLSLVYLMAGSSIPDIRSDPERAVLKVQERLRLDLSDEEAAVLLEGMLSTALAAWMPRLAEVQHRMAQVFR